MSPAWSYFWPVVAVGLVLGAAAGTVWLRRKRPWALAVGVAVGLAVAAAWHWPLGAATRFATAIEPAARAVLVDWEMGQVEAQLPRGPLTRRLILSGPADSFQRGELVRIMGSLPGVSSATWRASSPGVPLMVESSIVTLVGFLAGLLLAYVVELRRRYNAQWKW